MKFEKITSDIMGSIRSASKPKTSAYDTTATVTRIEDGIMWVHIPGGVSETPVQMTMSAAVGDSVQVRVSGGNAWLTGNATSPPTDDTTAVAAQATANNAAVLASSAKTAADEAATAAASAVASADEAAEAAAQAQTSASAAQASADNANEYAARALGGLSTVQSVAETLNWVTAHGTMTLTTDTALDPTHVYFVLDNTDGDYSVAKSDTFTGDGTETEFTLSRVPYAVTSVTVEDTEQTSGTDYTLSGAVITFTSAPESGNAIAVTYTAKYTIVTEPDVDDIGTYYELTIDESLNNYVGSHLALTSEGLWVLPAAAGYKILIALGTGTEYTTAGMYIVGPDGETIAQFGETTQIGEDGDARAYISPGRFRVLDPNDYIVLDARSSNTNKVGDKRYAIINFYARSSTGTETTFSGVGATISQLIKCYYTDDGTQMTLPSSFTDDSFTFDDPPEANRRFCLSFYTEQPIFSMTFGTRSTDSYAPNGGMYSATIGRLNRARWNSSMAIGYGCYAYSSRQLVVGHYNETDNQNLYVLIVGNGSDDSNRSNAMTVGEDGDMRLALNTAASSGTTDADLYDAICALGWESDVIN